MAEFNEWSISSSTDPNLDNVTDGSGPGEYIFKPPTDKAKNIYTIMYSYNGATGQTEYIVTSADCYTDECATSLVPPTVCFDPNQPQYDEQDSCIAMTVSHEPGSATTIFTLGKCWKFIGTSYPAQISNVTTDAAGGTSTIYYKQNSEEENIESVITYKFKNETANVTGQSDVTIIQEPNPCITATCANAPTLSKNPTTKASSTGDTVTISYSSLGECWRVDSKKIREGYEQYATLDDNNVVHVNPNTGSTADTSIMVDYVFVNRATNYPCPKEIEIIQEEGCNCSDVTYVEVVTAFTHEGGTAVIGNLTTCRRDLTTIVVKDGSEEYISSGPTIGTLTDDVYPVSITVKSNETRDTTYHVKYVINFNGQQCKPGESETPPYYDLIIEPKGCTCDCNYLKRIDKDKPYFFPTKDTDPGRPTLTNQILKELVMKDGFSSHCTYEDLEPYAIDTGITRIWTAVTGNILEIRGDIADITKEGEFKRALRFGLKVCGNDCNILKPPFYIFQRCYCGTDDCRNEYYVPGQEEPIIEDHPMYMGGCVENGWPSGWSHPFPKYPEGKYHGDADSVYVNSLYVVPVKYVGDDAVPLYATTSNPEGKVKLFHTVNGTFVADGSTFYWPDNRTSDTPVIVTYNKEGYPLGISIDVTTTRPMIGVASLIGAKTASTSSVTITYDEDGHTENVQMYTWVDDETKSLISENTKWEVLLTTDDDETVAGPNPGTDCCSKFITTIYQAKKDHFYNKDHREDDMARLDPCTY